MRTKCPKCKYEFDVVKSSILVPKEPKEKTTTLTALFVSAQKQNTLDSTIDYVTYGMKKGYDDIFKSINKHKGATWTELKSETSISTATLARRLHEGKKDGIIGTNRKGTTKRKIYMFRE